MPFLRPKNSTRSFRSRRFRCSSISGPRWCGPCRVVGPEVEKLALQRTGSLFVAKLNTDEIPQVASRFGIQGIPAFVLFRGGREAGRASGAMPAAQIEAAVGLR